MGALLTGKQSYTALGVSLGLLLLLAIVCVNMCGTSSDDASPPADALTLTADQIQELEKLEGEGLLRVEANLNRAYVAPALWAAMDAQQKEDFAAAIAIRAANVKGTQTYWAEIFDKQSGQKLAKWSRSYGFSVF